MAKIHTTSNGRRFVDIDDVIESRMGKSKVGKSVFPSEQDKQKAAEIVKRCGLRDGLFKGPRTLNAVKTVAYALAAERERCAVIVESFAAEIHMESADAADIAAAIREISDEQ